MSAETPKHLDTASSPFEGMAEGIVDALSQAATRARSRAGGTRKVRAFEGGGPGGVSTFGVFAERLDYLDGLVLSRELQDAGTKVISWNVRHQDGGKEEVYVGPVPDKYNPAKGGISVRNAGDPGEFILGVASPGHDMRFKYLDREDIRDVEVVPGDEVKFAGNDTRHRRVQMQPGAIVEPGLVGYR